MGASDGRDLASQLLEGPAGAALLAQLEIDQRADVASFEVPRDSDPDAVARAVRWLGERPFSDLAARVVGAAKDIAGPWTSDAPDKVASCIRLAGARRPIADAVVRRFHADLNRPMALDAQEWWRSASQADRGHGRARFTDFEQVYGNGEFTWAGLWTVSGPPGPVHDPLVSAWEMFPGPVTRWRLPVRSDARIWEISNPEDWSQLVRAYPKSARRAHGGWELPGPNQHQVDIRELLSVPGQRAARLSRVDHLLPDWRAVAADYDGVHLTWAGFLTSDGRICDLDAGAVTMLRYWESRSVA